jgi:hypothetical protein
VQFVQTLKRQFMSLEPQMLSKRSEILTTRVQGYRAVLNAIQDGLDEPKLSEFAQCVERGRSSVPAEVAESSSIGTPPPVSTAAALQAMRTPVTRRLYAEHLGQDAANQYAPDAVMSV